MKLGVPFAVIFLAIIFLAISTAHFTLLDVNRALKSELRHVEDANRELLDGATHEHMQCLGLMAENAQLREKTQKLLAVDQELQTLAKKVMAMKQGVCTQPPSKGLQQLNPEDFGQTIKPALTPTDSAPPTLLDPKRWPPEPIPVR